MYRIIDIDLKWVLEELPYRPELNEVLIIEHVEHKVIAHAGSNVFVKTVNYYPW